MYFGCSRAGVMVMMMRKTAGALVTMTGGGARTPTSSRNVCNLVVAMTLLCVLTTASATAPPTPAFSAPTPSPSPVTAASSIGASSEGADSQTSSFVFLAIACGVVASVGLGALTICFLCRRRARRREWKDERVGGEGHQPAIPSSSKESPDAAPFMDSAAWRVIEEGEVDGSSSWERTTNPLYAMPVLSTVSRFPWRSVATKGASTVGEGGGAEHDEEKAGGGGRGGRGGGGGVSGGFGLLVSPGSALFGNESKIKNNNINGGNHVIHGHGGTGEVLDGSSDTASTVRHESNDLPVSTEREAINSDADAWSFTPPSTEPAMARKEVVDPLSAVNGGGGGEGEGAHSPPQAADEEDKVGQTAEARRRLGEMRSQAPRRRSVQGRGRGSSVLKAAEGVVAGAESLALESFVPGAKETAALVAGLARLAAADHRGDAKDMRRRVKWCRSVVLTLERARTVLGKGTHTQYATEDDDEATRILLEDVQESVGDMVEIVQSYKNRHVVSEVFFSTLFKQRQKEADALIDAAEKRAKGSVPGEDPGHQRHTLSSEDIIVKAERKRRQRQQLDEVDIPASDVNVTDEILGMGGFGAVYLADFNGLNAAAKVVTFRTTSPTAHGTRPHDRENERDGGGGEEGGSEGQEDAELDQKARRRVAVAHVKRAASEARMEARQRVAVKRELEAMKRLRSPYTVHTYGAVTSVRDQLVLVMEFLPGGDLLLRLAKAKRPLDDGTLRGIVHDICSGMKFLHSEAFVHGDLKSANVLFDASGRAKIADLGTPLWTQSAARLATYSARPGGLMSLPWAAPEILRRNSATPKSDVYSFGVVVWECLTRTVPWAEIADVEALSLAVTSGERPVIPEDAQDEFASLAKVCWDQDPTARPSFRRILAGLNGSHEKGLDGGGGITGGATAVAAAPMPAGAEFVP